VRRLLLGFAFVFACAGCFGAKIARRIVANDQHNGDAEYRSEQGKEGGESQSSNSLS